MRKILTFLFSTIVLLTYGQADRAVKKPVKVYDTAHTVVFYDLQYLRDSTKTTVYLEGLTMLRISDSYLSFADYYAVYSDSLNDYAALSRKNDRAVDKVIGAIYKKERYKIPLLTNLQTQQTTFQMGVWTKLEYTVATPQIRWTLVEGDTVVANVACRKAVCRYAGRNYIAWYAESIQMPYGPYIFGGLPGLIMCIYDVKRNWIFTCNGIEPASSLRSMYLYTEKNREKMERKKALSIYRNELENMFSVGIAKGRLFNVPPELVRKTSSNMLELEW